MQVELSEKQIKFITKMLDKKMDSMYGGYGPNPNDQEEVDRCAKKADMIESIYKAFGH